MYFYIIAISSALVALMSAVSTLVARRKIRHISWLAQEAASVSLLPGREQEAISILSEMAETVVESKAAPLLTKKPASNYPQGQLRQFAAMVSDIWASVDEAEPWVGLLRYTEKKKASLLRNRRIEVHEAEFLDERSVLTLTYASEADLPHIIWIPPKDRVDPISRRFLIYHQLGHILLDDEDRLRYHEDDAAGRAETLEENRRANLFALMAILSRGAVAERTSMPADTWLAKFSHSNEFDIETFRRAHKLAVEKTVKPI